MMTKKVEENISRRARRNVWTVCGKTIGHHTDSYVLTLSVEQEQPENIVAESCKTKLGERYSRYVAERPAARALLSAPFLLLLGRLRLACTCTPRLRLSARACPPHWGGRHAFARAVEPHLDLLQRERSLLHPARAADVGVDGPLVRREHEQPPRTLVRVRVRVRVGVGVRVGVRNEHEQPPRASCDGAQRRTQRLRIEQVQRVATQH